MGNDESTSNPYLSPKVDSAGQVRGESWLGTYQPVVVPQDALDIIFGVGFGLLISAVIYGVPFAILFYFNAPIWWFLVITLMIVTLAIFVVNIGIRQVELTQDGIVATRRMLPSLQISWRNVESVRLIGRGSYLLATAFLPHRCCCYSFTSRGQVEIKAGRIRFYFPPQDYGTFTMTVRS
jgi:hypothetical protein